MTRQQAMKDKWYMETIRKRIFTQARDAIESGNENEIYEVIGELSIAYLLDIVTGKERESIHIALLKAVDFKEEAIEQAKADKWW